MGDDNVVFGRAIQRTVHFSFNRLAAKYGGALDGSTRRSAVVRSICTNFISSTCGSVSGQCATRSFGGDFNGGRGSGVRIHTAADVSAIIINNKLVVGVAVIIHITIRGENGDGGNHAEGQNSAKETDELLLAFHKICFFQKMCSEFLCVLQ